MLANKNQKFQFRLHLLMLIMSLTFQTTEAVRDRSRCEKLDYIQNGSYRMRRDRFMRINCKPGYQLQGPKTIECIRGKWEGEKPVCAKRGCKNNLERPENGRIQIENYVKAILYCSENYNLAGNRHSYCNGTHWDRPIGNCREHRNVVQHSCDFETDDICGWTYEPKEGLQWKRVMAANVFTSFKTGPRHDHTTMTANGGHYMLMESLTRSDDLVVLTSPIYDRSLSLKTACCFQFYYFMYGAGVGELHVVVKPISVNLNDLLQKRKDLIKFEKNGNQNNIWNEAHFNVEELEEDFQILFVAKAGHGQLSDIAVDDVRLLTGNDCKVLNKRDDEDNSNEEYDLTTYESIFDMQSCAGRCFDHQGVGIIKDSGYLKGLCSCGVNCEDNGTCCPDYRTVCLKEIFFESTTITSDGADTTKMNESYLNIATSTSPTTINTTISTVSTTVLTTPTTIKTTPTAIKTTPTTLKTTPTTIKTTPTTIKTTPTTIKTTTTTIKTTPTTKTTSIATTEKQTTTTINTTPPKLKITLTTVNTTPRSKTAKTTTKTTTETTIKNTAKAFKTTPTSIITKPTTTRTTTPKIVSTSTTKLTQTTKTTKRSSVSTKATLSDPVTTTATSASAAQNINPKVTTPISVQRPMEYKINDKNDPEMPLKSSNLLLYLFGIVLACIIAGIMYRRFGPKTVAWYMIHFKPDNRGGVNSTSITTSFNQITSKTKAICTKTVKKPSYSKNGIMATPLVGDYDDEEDNDLGVNGNIALKNHIYTEL